MNGDATTFNLYRLLVEEVREARRARRELSNAFLTLNLGGVGALGFLVKEDVAPLDNPALMLGFCAALLFTCWIWSTSNTYYTRMLKAKYDILYDVEARLEVRPIADEWRRLAPLKPRRSFSLEYSMPVLFALGYLAVLGYYLDWAGLAAAIQDAWASLGQLR